MFYTTGKTIENNVWQTPNRSEMSMMAFLCYVLLFSVSSLTPWNFEITVLSLLDLLFYSHTGDRNGEFLVEMIVPTLSINFFYE